MCKNRQYTWQKLQADPRTTRFSTETCQFKISILPQHKLANWFALASHLFSLSSETPNTTETKQHLQKVEQSRLPTKKKTKKPQNHNSILFRNTEVSQIKPCSLSRKLRKVFLRSRFSLRDYSPVFRVHHCHLHVAYPTVCSGSILKP